MKITYEEASRLAQSHMSQGYSCVVSDGAGGFYKFRPPRRPIDESEIKTVRPDPLKPIFVLDGKAATDAAWAEVQKKLGIVATPWPAEPDHTDALQKMNKD